LIVVEVPVQCHQSTSIERERERERERESIREVCDLLVGGGEEHWRRIVFVDVNVGLAYKFLRVTREVIDDGMVPLS